LIGIIGLWHRETADQKAGFAANAQGKMKPRSRDIASGAETLFH
jgi:hypothetical protein